MQKGKKKPISNKKERVLLSDVLPFELPPTFTNRYFKDFLIKNKVEINGKSITYKKDDKALDKIIEIFSNFNNVAKDCDSRDYKYLKLENKTTIPFNFKISHDNNEFRELTIIHPLNQLEIINHYDSYKDLIVYYSQISPFSIRRPDSVAKVTYQKRKSQVESVSHRNKNSLIGEFEKEYEELKTFFSIKDYKHIFEFYESYRYHRCEKKFDNLFKFDISKCFDSIYSHSISWAIYNKEIVKERISESKKTFPGSFDSLMQGLNHGETNGIVIGPEFSRIFAELILQQIDFKVFQILKQDGILLKKHYELFRYVDDFFVFYNENKILEEIMKVYRLVLKEFKLTINDSKSFSMNKPLITGITIAKIKLNELFEDKSIFKIKKDEYQEREFDEKKYKYFFHVTSNKLITKFKTIIQESGVQYRDVLNYTLAIVERQSQKLIDYYTQISEKPDFEKAVVDSVLNILDFSFFLYSVSPKVNTTIKICTTLSKFIDFVKIKSELYHESKHLILKKIYDEVFLLLKKVRSPEHTQIETLYLLIILKELGKEYRLSEELLAEHFNFDLENKVSKNNLNHFSITVFLFYIGNKKRYPRIKTAVLNQVLEKFQNVKLENRAKDTELILLFFDLIVCPYLDRDFKNKLFSFFGIEGRGYGHLRTEMINKQNLWFTRWNNFDFGKALEGKKSEEVY